MLSPISGKSSCNDTRRFEPPELRRLVRRPMRVKKPKSTPAETTKLRPSMLPPPKDIGCASQPRRMKMPSVSSVKKRMRRISINVQGEDFKIYGLAPFKPKSTPADKPHSAMAHIAYSQVHGPTHRFREFGNGVSLPKPNSPYVSSWRQTKRRHSVQKRTKKKRRRRKRKARAGSTWQSNGCHFST
ncbi:uncharacterized protein LOC110990450 [Acanthaster planci]|uniref:Uncharacterized protein LOC110990450 n=1 Tax=Acanthaster planci TaxID=133434 RepID=A0A8B8A0E6_ACAPL|nr:uncharacterized protein LOC110990450 [Acanthaster planci]